MYKSEEQESAMKKFKNLYESRKKVKITSLAKYKSVHGEGLKILTPKQMFQRLPKAPEQAKTGSTSANLLNEIRQIIYSLCRAKEITKKVHNNIMNSIKL